MNPIRQYSRRSFVLIFFFMTVLLVLVKYISYFGINEIDQRISLLMRSDAPVADLKMAASGISNLLYDVRFYIIPVSTVSFCFVGLLLWIFLRRFAVKWLKAPAASDQMKPAAEDSGKKAEGKREKKQQDRRLFLYLMAVLQREGRLLDFFSEDLENYDDAQIGAAVRSVHANCQKVIRKTLVPKPVIDRNEGETITVDRGFDPGSVVLTGNVVGEPPFRGILRHKGWQARKMELPTLSGTGDAGIIMPAEVEVLKPETS